MSNTFLNKVAAERAALAVVNRRWSGARQLPGLSSAAIEQWRGKVFLPVDHRVVLSLIEIGRIAQTLSNKSNESFTSLSPEVKATLDLLLEDLAAAICDVP